MKQKHQDKVWQEGGGVGREEERAEGEDRVGEGERGGGEEGKRGGDEDEDEEERRTWNEGSGRREGRRKRKRGRRRKNAYYENQPTIQSRGKLKFVFFS